MREQHDDQWYKDRAQSKKEEEQRRGVDWVLQQAWLEEHGGMEGQFYRVVYGDFSGFSRGMESSWQETGIETYRTIRGIVRKAQEENWDPFTWDGRTLRSGNNREWITVQVERFADAAPVVRVPEAGEDA